MFKDFQQRCKRYMNDCGFYTVCYTQNKHSISLHTKQIRQCDLDFSGAKEVVMLWKENFKVRQLLKAQDWGTIAWCSVLCLPIKDKWPLQWCKLVTLRHCQQIVHHTKSLIIFIIHMLTYWWHIIKNEQDLCKWHRLVEQPIWIKVIGPDNVVEIEAYFVL